MYKIITTKLSIVWGIPDKIIPYSKKIWEAQTYISWQKEENGLLLISISRRT